METKSLLMEIVGCFLGLFLSVIFVSTCFSGSPDGFDILGIKLGMTPEDLVKAKPECPRTSEYKDYRKYNDPSKFLTVCGGPALDWQIEIKGTGEPYGNGVFEIKYQKSVDMNVDTKIFIGELKTQLEAKYGKASFEKIKH